MLMDREGTQVQRGWQEAFVSHMHDMHNYAFVCEHSTHNDMLCFHLARYECLVPGNPALAAEYKKKLFCFASEECLDHFMRLVTSLLCYFTTHLIMLVHTCIWYTTLNPLPCFILTIAKCLNDLYFRAADQTTTK